MSTLPQPAVAYTESKESRGEAVIMEAASENTQEKARRGRPRFMTEKATAAYRRLWPEVTTTRHLANKRYMTRALGLLQDDARFRWLCDKEQMKVGAPKSWTRYSLNPLGCCNPVPGEVIGAPPTS